MENEVNTFSLRSRFIRACRSATRVDSEPSTIGYVGLFLAGLCNGHKSVVRLSRFTGRPSALQLAAVPKGPLTSGALAKRRDWHRAQRPAYSIPCFLA